MEAIMKSTTTLILIFFVANSNAEFVEVPTNVTVPEGFKEGAVFICSHMSTNAFIDWTIDSLSVDNLNHPNVSSPTLSIENGIRVSTLIVPATLRYNGSLVVCVAFTVNGRQETPPAILTVVAGPSTTTEPTATEGITTEYTIIPIFSTNFIETPLPSMLVTTLEERYEYTCSHSQTNRLLWIVNGSRLIDIVPPPDLISFTTMTLPSGVTVYTLQIGQLLQHNGTVIQCLAQSQDQLSTAVTPNVTFLIQGPLQSVDNLARNAVVSTIEWDAPFSLDLTNAEPDIVYCVEVYNITCGRSLVISDCDVFESSYSSDDLRPGYIYEYTVTPRSNVEGAQNGTNLLVSENFKQLSLTSHSLKINLPDGRNDVSALTALNFVDLDVQHSVVSSSYVLSLSPIDGVELGENESSLLVPATSRRNEDTVTLTTFLPFRRRFSYTVLAHGCEENPVTDAMEISTHDIQNVLIASPLPKIVRITGEFIQGLTSLTSIGVLAIIIPLNLDLAPTYRFIPPESTTSLGVADIRVSGGDYSISVFVVEESGLPFTRTASTPITVTVSGGKYDFNSSDSDNVSLFASVDETPLTIDYELLANSTGVCITCTLMKSSTATDCVAVVHQRISQLNSSAGLMNIESSHKFTRSGDTASGCIEGVNLEDYQVGVFSVNTEVEITDPPTEEDSNLSVSSTCWWCIIVASVIPSLFLIAIGLISVVLCAAYALKKSRSEAARCDEREIELNRCGAYQVVELSRQRVKMSENPAYGEVGAILQ